MAEKIIFCGPGEFSGVSFRKGEVKDLPRLLQEQGAAATPAARRFLRRSIFGAPETWEGVFPPPGVKIIRIYPAKGGGVRKLLVAEV